MKIGESLLIEPKSSLKPEKYPSKIVGISDHSFFAEIPPDVSAAGIDSFVDGTGLRISYKSADGSIYKFETEVIGKIIAPVPMFHLKYPDKVAYRSADGTDYMFDTDISDKLQAGSRIVQDKNSVKLREFVRVETPVKVLLSSKNSGFETITGTTKDISAGGAAIFVPERLSLHPDTIIEASFSLLMKDGKTRLMKVDCKVIRLLERPGFKENLLAVQFLDISNDDRQILLRFCFDKQLELRNIGK